MADPWAEFRDSTTSKGLPPIMAEGAGKFSPKIENDPWAEFREQDKKEEAKVLKTKYPTEFALQGKLPKFVTDWLGQPEDSPNPLTMTKQIGKGIPAVRHFIPEDEDMKRMQENYPITTQLARGTGAVGSTMPLSVAAGALTGTNTALTGAKMIPAIAAQSSLGGILGAGDIAAEKGKDVTGKDLMNSAGVGALWGSTGPIASKLLSPGTVIPTRPTGPTRAPPVEKPSVENIRARSRVETGVDPAVNAQLQALLDSRHVAAQAAQQTEQRAAQQAGREATETRLRGINPRGNTPSTHNDSLQNILIRMAGAGFLPAITHQHPAITAGAAAFGAIAPHIPAAGAKYWHNINMVQPNTKDIINALMTSQGIGQ